MNTMFLLMAEYETPAVPLSDICEKYLGIKPSTAESKASLGQLCLPTFRLGESQKSPRLVYLQDLAELIDRKRKEAKEFLEYMNR
ncbi:pyocin activator protein PrtN [Salmonella enterica]|uniref:Pyocin activator protein PrtN n=1 Tax=Salmonella enterica subsp. houtenae serovar 45:g,z51:- TaxID=1967611 RepID=A0A753EHV7_SALHO|nr:pyocin activator PrtN family protein [Salmonella enterica]EBP3940323.1 pyocin activator protein PrtN [Salmonella enterica subsp. enterica]ECT8412103.1 pyocin activator protein PrtN [Salmonella enterica subsp. houtenae serovar 45:g,z51:-]EEC0963254.1 pyocin activator protein PrtN [Salmonella enterica subsp. enterica serovar Baguida]HAF0294598.1 pyocin activator protein PrtN [Salmonella enterica subsp. houtenae serovar 43:z4,z32:-]AXD28279.1 pyocin activator protein PrtN [Salmonella enterica]